MISTVDIFQERQTVFNNSLKITTLTDLEELDREHTRSMTHEQRMEYLQKLNFNLYGPDFSKQEAELKKGELKIRKTI